MRAYTARGVLHWKGGPKALVLSASQYSTRWSDGAGGQLAPVVEAVFLSRILMKGRGGRCEGLGGSQLKGIVAQPSV